jgi:hypothetical protein
VNSDDVTLGFTVATPIPVGGKIAVLLPLDFFSSFNNTYLLFLSGSSFGFYSRCFLSKGLIGSLFDSLDCFLAARDVCANCPSSTSISYHSHSSLAVFSFIAPKPGNYRLMFSSAANMGLAATYYAASCNTTVSQHWTFGCPAIASAPSGTASEWTLAYSAGRTGTNLAGFIKAPVRGLYRFYLRTLTGRGSGDLWIGNSRIIASEGAQEGYFLFQSLLHYDFQMAYSKLNSSDATMQLEWESNKMFRQTVGKNFLFTSVNLDFLNTNSTVSIVA